MTFRTELEKLINRFSHENGSNTPDYILADYLKDSLAVFDKAVKERERWYGRAPSNNVNITDSLPPGAVVLPTGQRKDVERKGFFNRWAVKETPPGAVGPTEMPAPEPGANGPTGPSEPTPPQRKSFFGRK